MTNVKINYYTLLLKYNANKFMNFNFANSDKHTSKFVSAVVIGILDNDGETMRELFTGRKIYKAKEERENRLTYTEANLATVEDLAITASVVRLINDGYKVVEGFNKELDNLEHYTEVRYEEYKKNVDDITDFLIKRKK